MDDKRSNVERLSKVLNRDSVELVLIKLLIEFHSVTPVKRIEWVLMVEWEIGIWRLSFIRVGYIWNEDFFFGTFYQIILGEFVDDT